VSQPPQVNPEGRPQSAEELLQALLSNIQEILYVVDGRTPHGKVRLVSGYVYSVLGCRPQEFLDDPSLWFRLLHPEDTEIVMSSLERAIAQRSSGLRTYRLRNQLTGEYKWVEDRFTPIFDADWNYNGIYGVARDITAQREAEAIRQESEERFRLIAETVSEVFWIADPAIRKMRYVSPAYERIWRRSRESLYQNPRSFLDAIHPDDLEHVLATLDLQATNQPFEHEYRIIWPEGTVRWIWDRGFPSLDENGVASYYVGAAQDITVRKAMEGYLHRLSGQILHSRDDERKMIAQDLHDGIGQTLIALSLNLAKAKDAVRRPPRGFQNLMASSLELTEQCLREIRALTYLLHPPLLEHGGLPYALPWLGRNLTERSGMRIDLAVDSAVGRFTPEIESCFFRVAQEALQNCVVHSGSPTATIRLRRENDVLTMEIQDNGMGIGSHLSERTGSAADGGIGLISMRERLDRIGGKLTIESSAQGTTVRASKALAEKDSCINDFAASQQQAAPTASKSDMAGDSSR
jgi:PAS domain S-box-containing protein